MNGPTRLLILTAALAVGAPCLSGRCGDTAVAQEAEKKETGTLYHFGTAVSRTNITFESETELETIHGITHDVSGSARLDFEAGKGSTKLVVPVASMKTGMDTRDEHLRTETWMDVANHPNITFEATELVKKNKPKEGETDDRKWTWKGTITIKGVTKEISGEATVFPVPSEAGTTLGKGDWVKVKTSFKVKITDFGIKIPSVQVAAKVSEEWTIGVSIFGTTQKPEK
jgi:polyisoprenoid-binding protein YceI